MPASKRTLTGRYAVARYHIDLCGGLGTTSDLARRWGISRERVRQLSILEGFPEEVVRAGRNTLYFLGECDDWRTARRDAA